MTEAQHTTDDDTPARPANQARPARHSLDAKIKILVSPNPHRKGTKSHGYYRIYQKGCRRKSGFTLAQALQAGIPRAEINWHEDRGIIALVEPEVAS